MNIRIPRELNLIETRVGYTMKGWDFTQAQVEQAITKHWMLNPAFELGTNYCPWNCGFCFTEEPGNLEGDKRRLKNEMILEEKLSLINEAYLLGARSINFVGAGEPTIDPDFWKIIDHMRGLCITPIVYTEGTLRLTDRHFVERLYRSGVTVVLKVNSLWNHVYQDAIVAGPAGRKRPHSQRYSKDREVALELLMKTGFNSHNPTRLAFDTIICRQNKGEVLRLHRWARDNNIFVLFVNYLPSGRSSDGLHDAIGKEEQFELFRTMAEIDRDEYGLVHDHRFPYSGGVPCTIRGLGLYVKITGAVHDCPGELVSFGNVRETSLHRIWNSRKVMNITAGFDGGCAPRDAFWHSHEQSLKQGKRIPLRQI